MPTRYVPKLSRDEMERRRLNAVPDLRDPETTQAEIADKYNVSSATVSRWNATLEEEGITGLKRSNPPGPEPKLTDEDLQELEALLLEGAQAYGFETDLWTGPRVARVIEETFGVTYHEKYVPQLLRDRMGFSYQKPERVAQERDEAERQRWLQETWEDDLKKGRSTGTGSSASSTSPPSA